MVIITPAIRILDGVGGGLMFLGEIIRTLRKYKIDREAILTQIYNISMASFFTTASSGFFVGALMSVQFNMQLRQFGALSVLGGLSTSATVRELGPLLIAFMLSGKVGAYTSAELGIMRVTEQIDAMRCLGTNPMQYLVAPRFLGIIISAFFLLFLGLLMSILGGVILATLVADLSPSEFINTIPMYVEGHSVLSGLFKCLCFSVLLATVCTYKGYTTTGGAKGVGKTVLATALATMVGLVLLDWFTTYLAGVLLDTWRAITI
ncbi:MAG: ABC transporter permease [Oligoflexia bacterium]|nr:ABC transporter permease [Oligoflexia bacterium]